MRYNLQFPGRAAKYLDSWVEDGRFSDFGVAAEEAGFDGVAVYDHPLPEDGWVNNGGHIVLDPLISLAAIAERTTRVRLLTNILVLAYRGPYVSAQALATIDKFSGGRVTVGLGAGYQEPEFRVLGADFENRGKKLDDGIAAMREAWTGQSLDRDGLFPAHGHTMYPSPVQEHVPIWIGGNSNAAIKRAVNLADGWMPISLTDVEAAASGTPAMPDFETLQAKLADVQKRRADVGKPPMDIAFSPFERWIRDWEESATELAKNIRRYEDAGVTWITIVAKARTLTELRADVARFHDIVISKDTNR